MMIFYLAFLASFALAIGSVSDTEWTAFKTKYAKVYKDLSTERRHRDTYSRSIDEIKAHNELFRLNKSTFTMGINKFADLTYEEFSEVMLMPTRHSTNSQRRGTVMFEGVSPNKAVPDTVDWRTKGYVTPVKDQGQCGSCWAFSTVGGLEGQHFAKTGKLVSLSEQNLVDCAGSWYGNYGCNGGNIEGSFQYVKDNGGIDTEQSYPYNGYDGSCKYRSAQSGATCRGYVNCPSGDEVVLKQAVGTVGPVSGCFYASDSFQRYSGGIYYGFDCPRQGTNHCILIVGYGTDNGLDYWLVKNSWGRSWGEDGYIRMSRNRNNNCQIATDPAYPLV